MDLPRKIKHMFSSEKQIDRNAWDINQLSINSSSLNFYIFLNKLYITLFNEINSNNRNC